MAGETATHTVALCHLLVDGESFGLNWFIIPLRDPTTGKLLPGVTAGNLGAKAGRGGLDNGWIQFTQVHIPKSYLLCKWTRINPDGEVLSSPKAYLAYATLINERIVTLRGTANFLGQACTIAARYSCVRRQGRNDEQILDYQSQYTRLMPGIASVYVFLAVDK